MEVKPAKREWVKNAAIIFLAVLLVLTFFSNTIMNRTLPEAATAFVTSGTITAKVRGSGKVTANGLHEVKTDQTRTVRSVMVKAGQEVSTGDVLFVLGQGDSKELEAAKETLRQLQLSYQTTAVGMPVFNYTQEQYNLSTAEQRWTAAITKEDDELAKAHTLEASPTAQALKKGWDVDARAALQVANDNYEAHTGNPATEQALVDEVTKCQQALDALASLPNPDPNSIDWLTASANLTAAQSALSAYYSTSDTLYNAVVAAQTTFDERKAAYEEYVYPPSVQAAIAEREVAEQEYFSALYTLESKKASDNQSLAASSVQLQGIAQQIEAQQEKIKKLSGDEGNQIVANVNGTVDSIGITAGGTATPETVLCTIEIPDMGHSLSFSVTTDQAQRLRVGDTATVSNYYWGQEIVATLTNIKNDPKSPQNSKVLTFDLTGDVTTGSELTISVGKKSASYDLIIPNSSIRSDTNGSFVLAVDAKNSPLGNRYITRRVSVEVLASDDVNSAVTGGLNNGDYVVTTSSAPIKAGDQVRMAEASS